MPCCVHVCCESECGQRHRTTENYVKVLPNDSHNETEIRVGHLDTLKSCCSNLSVDNDTESEREKCVRNETQEE